MYDPNNAVQVAQLRAEVVENQAYYGGDPGSTEIVVAMLHDRGKPRVAGVKTLLGLTGLGLSADITLSDAEYAAVVNTRNRELLVESALDLKSDLIPGWDSINNLPTEMLKELDKLFTEADAPTIRAGMMNDQCTSEILFGDGTRISTKEYQASLEPSDAPRLMNTQEQQDYTDDCVVNNVMSREAAELKAPAKQSPGQTVTWS